MADVEHQVLARKEGGGAVLQCQVCGAQGHVAGSDLESVNDFLGKHKACSEPWSDGDTVRWEGLAGGRP